MGKRKRKVVLASILFLLAMVLYTVAMQWNGFAAWFTSTIYDNVSVIFAWFFGLFPFSFVEIGIYILGICIVVGLVWNIIALIKKKKSVKALFANFAVNTILVASILFFLYVVNCGINYQNISFAEQEQFKVTKYTREELIEVCNMLTEQINSLESKLDKDENGNVVIGKNAENEAANAMKAIGKIYPSLKGYFPRPKQLLVSEILSYQQVSGIYSPFTVEANINGDMPEYMKPFTMCHELSHLKGIMREEEANFVAYLACRNSEVPYFQYSGAMTAYYYCMTELRKYDAQQYATIRNLLCDTANVDIESKYEFWNRYEGVVATVSNKVNDAYLKANSQSAGVSSYNEVTGLIMALYRVQ